MTGFDEEASKSIVRRLFRP